MFVDTLPNPQAAEGGDAQGEAQGGRRRNRRGGRGRDRDDSRPDERADAANEATGSADSGETMSTPSADVPRGGAPVFAGADASDDQPIDTIEARRDDGAGAPTGEGAAAEPRGEGSRRRGRGGRGRDRERGPRDGEAIGNDAFASDRTEATDPMSTPFGNGADAGGESTGGGRRDEPMATAAPSPTREVEPAREVASDAWRSPEAALRSAPAAERAAPVAAPAPASASAAPVTPYALPLDSLVAVAESAGLQWVNSDAGKIEAAQAAMAAAAEPIHMPRDIPPVAAVDEGPLVLVETKKDLSQVKLPFETMPRETQGL
jgi:ribonuclease E